MIKTSLFSFCLLDIEGKCIDQSGFVQLTEMTLKEFLYFIESEIQSGFPLDHSFLTYKKELTKFGYMVGKISIKEETVRFEKIKQSGIIN